MKLHSVQSSNVKPHKTLKKLAGAAVITAAVAGGAFYLNKTGKADTFKSIAKEKLSSVLPESVLEKLKTVKKAVNNVGEKITNNPVVSKVVDTTKKVVAKIPEKVSQGIEAAKGFISSLTNKGVN